MCFRIPLNGPAFPRLARLLLAALLALCPVLAPAAGGGDADRALFWLIRKGESPAGYLLGTIHSEDPRVLEFSAALLERLRTCRVFAMELVPDVPTLARLNEYMQYPPGQGLEAVIGAERFESVASALSAYPVALDSVRRMKPWAVMMTLSTPPAETGFFMDLSLSLRASGSGLQLLGLETLEQQLSFLEDMPLAMQLSLLDQTIAESGSVRAAHDRMVEAYLENDLDGLRTLSEEQFESVGGAVGDYFMAEGIRARNRRMLASLLPRLEGGGVFVAVGALHLPGEAGLLDLLRGQGFELEPLETPFAEAGVGPGAPDG